jgi:DNA replication licensing factor MCM4
MRFSSFVEFDDVKEAYRLMRDAIRTSATDPKTGKIDMGLLDTGVGQQDRKLRGDMGKELLNILDGAGNRGIRWTDALKQLEGQSSIRINTAEFSEVIKTLEREGLVKVVGDRERRTIRRIEGA